MLNRRERILVFAILTIVVGYALTAGVRRLFLSPLDAQTARLQSLRAEVASKDRQIKQAQQARAQLAEWEQMSLPPDERTAQSLYMQFLVELMQQCQVEEGVPAPAKPIHGKYFTRIPFTIKGKMSVDNLTEFLYRFYQPKLLHQIESLTINQVKGPSELLDVTLRVEALALKGAPSRQDLLEGRESGGLLTGIDRDQFRLISQKNIFRPFREPRAIAQAPSRPREPEVDEARFVVFVGAPVVERDQEVWLYNQLTNQMLTLQAGDEFEIAGIKGHVTAANDRDVTFENGGKLWRLTLRQSLREMQPASTQTAGSQPDGEPASKDEPSPDKAAEQSPEPVDVQARRVERPVPVGELPNDSQQAPAPR